jgi:hypothetical protein
MNTTEKKNYRGELTLGILLIAIALSIIIPYLFNINYWIIGPAIILLIIGFWCIYLGFLALREGSPKFTYGPRNSTYFIGGGSLLSITGFLFIVHWFVPEANLLLLLAFLILLIGVIIITARAYTRKQVK